MKRSIKIRLCRWGDVLLLGLTAYLVKLFLEPFCLGIRELLMPQLQKIHIYLLITVALILIWLVGFFLVQIGALNHKFGIVRPFLYPPVWGAVFVVYFLSLFRESGFLVYGNEKIQYETHQMLVFVLAVFVGVVYSKLRDWLRFPKGRQEKALNSIANIDSSNKDSSWEWIYKEGPIPSIEEDRFGFSSIVERIVEKCLDKKSLNIGLVGPYGSGKTSTTKLVVEEIEKINDRDRNQEIVPVHLSVWNVESDILARVVLDGMLGEMKRYVDCSAISFLPMNYARAFSKSNSMPGDLLRTLLQINHDPFPQLEKLDSILEAINVKLLVIMEDIDRNYDSKRAMSELPVLIEKGRLHANYSYIITVGLDYEFASDVLYRVCDEVEYMI